MKNPDLKYSLDRARQLHAPVVDARALQAACGALVAVLEAAPDLDELRAPAIAALERLKTEREAAAEASNQVDLAAAELRAVAAKDSGEEALVAARARLRELQDAGQLAQVRQEGARAALEAELEAVTLREREAGEAHERAYHAAFRPLLASAIELTKTVQAFERSVRIFARGSIADAHVAHPGDWAKGVREELARAEAPTPKPENLLVSQTSSRWD